MSAPLTDVTPAVKRREGRRLLGRASLNLVDQGLSALSNVVLSFLVAKAVDADEYGAFAVAFLVFSLLIGLERSLVGTPMAMSFAGATGKERHRAVTAAIGATLATTLTAAGVTAVVGAVLAWTGFSTTLGTTLIVLALVLPGLIVQDACRQIFFAHATPQHAVVNDVIWTVIQFAVMAVLFVNDVRQPWPYVLAWGGAATVAAAVGLRQLRVSPTLRGTTWWMKSQIKVTGYLLMEYVIGTGSSQGSILLVGAVGSLGDVGSLRAAQTLLGPLGIVTTAVLTFAVPEVARRTGLSGHQRGRIALVVSSVVLVGSLVYAALLLLIPDAVGVALLGDTWRGASSVLLPMALVSAAAGGSLGPAIIIYAGGHANRTFRLHLVEAPMFIVFMLVGLVLGGTPGAAWGMAVSTVIMIFLWFWQLYVLLVEHHRLRESTASPA